MSSKPNMKQVIYNCISNIQTREEKEYVKLEEIYQEVSNYLEVENNEKIRSQIRGRLQENCSQYTSFTGEDLFYTEKIRSGNWTIKKNKKKFIRYINNTFLITENNWLSLEKVTNIDGTYEQESDLDNIYKAKLIERIGNLKANIIVQELNKIRSLLLRIKNINKVNDGYGTAFEVFAISTIYNIDYEECINKYIIHGDKDGKIDAIYYGDNKNIFIYQIKITEIDNDDYNKMQINYDYCLRNTIPDNGKDLYNFVKEHLTLLEEKNIVYKSISENSKRSTNYKPLEIYEMYFKNKLLPLNNNNITLTLLKPRRIENDIYRYNISTDGENNFNFYMKASELITYLLKSLGLNPNNYDKNTVDISKYFFDNVRGVLSVNKKMINTIENEPQNFIKYNNGISITGEVEDLGCEITIKNPVINNGQQTITTLIRKGKNLDKITLSIKVTNEIDIKVKEKISQYSNEQVKVKAIDMLSLNHYIRKVQETIFLNGEYFLEIYSSGKKSYNEILKKLYPKNNIIKLLDFIKLYFSLQNNKDLGSWKNNPNSQVDKIIINDYLNKEESFRVCKAIADYENYIATIENKKEKDDLKSADLAFKYLLCKENLKEEEAFEVIKMINKEYFYKYQDEKSKLIDIYKSSSIINKLEEQLQIYRKNKEKQTSIPKN